MGVWEWNKTPTMGSEFVEPRNKQFSDLLAGQQAEIEKKAGKAITITLPDGAKKEGIAFKTTPLDIANEISAGFARKQCVAKANGTIWDLTRPLEADCTLVFLDFDSEEGKDTYWHSSAHILGEALERLYGAKLCTGPPIENGFYYDVRLPEGATISTTDFKKIEAEVNKILKEKQPFQRLETSKTEAVKMFEYSKYKSEILKDTITEDSLTVYSCGSLTDICTGPHLPDTGKVKAFHITTPAALTGERTPRTTKLLAFTASLSPTRSC